MVKYKYFIIRSVQDTTHPLSIFSEDSQKQNARNKFCFVIPNSAFGVTSYDEAEHVDTAGHVNTAGHVDTVEHFDTAGHFDMPTLCCAGRTDAVASDGRSNGRVK